MLFAILLYQRRVIWTSWNLNNMWHALHIWLLWGIVRNAIPMWNSNETNFLCILRCDGTTLPPLCSSAITEKYDFCQMQSKRNNRHHNDRLQLYWDYTLFHTLSSSFFFSLVNPTKYFYFDVLVRRYCRAGCLFQWIDEHKIKWF